MSTVLKRQARLAEASKLFDATSVRYEIRGRRSITISCEYQSLEAWINEELQTLADTGQTMVTTAQHKHKIAQIMHTTRPTMGLVPSTALDTCHATTVDT